MTIATGFVFNGGLLFCVDTKISSEIKTNESKIAFHGYTGGDCATLFAISGADLHFPKAAIKECEDAVERINFPGATIESVRKTIQSALGKFYKEHIFPHPDRADGVVYFQMLIGIWLRGETRMFVSNETVLAPVDEYECLGTGSYLAKYLIRRFLRSGSGLLTLADAAMIAEHAVSAIIDYDSTCGGEPETVIMRNSGDISNAYETAMYPNYYLLEKLHTETWRVLRELAQVEQDGDMATETRRVLEKHFDLIRGLNAGCEQHFKDILRFRALES